MNDSDDPGWDADARRDLAGLDEALARWAEETGARLGTAPAGGARPAATRRPVEPTPHEERPEAGPPRPRTDGRWWALPSGILAAAAAVAAILLARGPGRAPPAPGESGVALVADGLDAASDGPFMVVPTRNPDIAVIWMLDNGD